MPVNLLERHREFSEGGRWRIPFLHKGLSRQARPKIRGRVRVRPTLYGWILLFLLFWLPLTAVGSANNFLFIVFVMLLGVALVSHVLGKRNVSCVDLSRRFPDEIFAGTPFPVQYVVRTSLMRWGAVTLNFAEAAPLVLRDDGAAFPQVRPGEARVFTHFGSITSRGEHRVGPGILRSTFPFGLARYERPCGSSDTVLVFPRIEALREPLPFRSGRAARGQERADLIGTIPYHFREYASGDPYKHIDWKKTARTGALITRVFSEEGSRTVVVTLPREPSEEAISKAASLAVHCGNLGIPVSLRGPGINVEPGVGAEFIRSMLTVLAKWDQRVDESPVSTDAVGLVAEIDWKGSLTWKTSGGADVPRSNED